MNTLPFVIWMLGFFAVDAWRDIHRHKSGMSLEESPLSFFIWIIVGTLLWFNR